MSEEEEYYFENNPYFHPILKLDDLDRQDKVNKLVNRYRVSISKLSRLRKQMNEELQNGIVAKPVKPSKFPMINTFVTRFPHGTEVGTFLGLDIGGTNLRIIYVVLSKKPDGGYQKSIDFENFDVPREFRQGSSAKFFGFLATCIEKFLDNNLDRKTLDKPLPLGFTFSFGFDQFAIDKGVCMQFGIHTNLPDAIGRDPVELLQGAIDERSLPVRVVALANDSTTVLVYGKLLDPHTSISFILGSGSNVAYVEKVARFTKIADPVKTFGPDVDEFICNSECVLYGDDGAMDFAKTPYDFELDAGSLMPNSYTYEKIVGGAFLGELFRITLVDLVRNGLLLGGRFTKNLVTPHTVDTARLSAIDGEIVKQGGKSSLEVNSLLQELGYEAKEITADDVKIVSHVCQLITIRGGIFSAAAISVFVDHVDRSIVKIACDGSVFKKHPKMERLIGSYLAQLCPSKQTKVFLADNGSSIGAAIVAACYTQTN